MGPRDTVVAVLIALLMGLNFIVIQAGMRGVPALLFLAIRFAVVLFPAVLWVPRPDLRWRQIVAIGTFMCLGQFSLLYVAIAMGISPGIAALILQGQSMFSIGLAAVMFDERPTGTQWTGAAVAVIGLALVAYGRGGATPLVAVLLCVLAALSWGLGNVLARRAQSTSGLSLAVWSSVVVPIPALTISLLLDGPHAIASALAGFGWSAVWATLYSAVVISLLAYALLNTLLARHPAVLVTPWLMLSAPVAMAASALFLHDRPSALEVFGALLLLGGVLMATLARPGRDPAPRDDDAVARL